MQICICIIRPTGQFTKEIVANEGYLDSLFCSKKVCNPSKEVFSETVNYFFKKIIYFSSNQNTIKKKIKVFLTCNYLLVDNALKKEKDCEISMWLPEGRFIVITVYNTLKDR